MKTKVLPLYYVGIESNVKKHLIRSDQNEAIATVHVCMYRLY